MKYANFFSKIFVFWKIPFVYLHYNEEIRQEPSSTIKAQYQQDIKPYKLKLEWMPRVSLYGSFFKKT